MATDPFRERDLAGLGIQASVQSANGICTVRLTVDAFDRMVSAVASPAAEPTWYEQVKDQLDDAEDALREAAAELRRLSRNANNVRGVA